MDVAAATMNGLPWTRRLSVVTATTFGLLFICRLTLLATSAPLDRLQREQVSRAIMLLEDHGFSSETIVLRHLTSFRGSDNWWNVATGHGEAYAATNFPFEVVTLYAPFFEATTDDVERAVILLHEAYHLLGGDEEKALDGVWRSKARLGWKGTAYGGSRVWKNTREWTMSSLPHLFACGADGQSDCME